MLLVAVAFIELMVATPQLRFALYYAPAENVGVINLNIAAFESGESSDSYYYTRQIAYGEYLPVPVVNSEDPGYFLLSRPRQPEVLSGEAELSAYTENGSHATMTVEVVDDDTVLELPYLYYPGFEAELDGRRLQTGKAPSGLLQVVLPAGSSGELSTWYGMSPATRLGLGLAIATALGCAAWAVARRLWRA